MSNSPLVTYTKLSPNRTSPRNHKIDTITIHCTAGQGTAKSILNLSHFVKKNLTSGASCNYAVGKDGSIGLGVEEKNRSFCTSNRANDHRAITIEVSSDSKPPYAVTDAAYAALIDLLVDICQRNDIKELKWKGDKSLIGKVDKQNMTVHMWFKNKACPGEYLYTRHGAIAAEVNRRLGVKVEEKTNALEVDGVWGPSTTRRAQEVFGTTVDGKISNQNIKYAAANPGLSASTFVWEEKPKGSSQLIKAIQKKAGMLVRDGRIGPKTITAMQKWLGTTQDGVVSRPSQMVKAFQRWLNAQ